MRKSKNSPTSATDIDQRLAELATSRLATQDDDLRERLYIEIDYWLDLKLEQREARVALKFRTARHPEGNPGS